MTGSGRAELADLASRLVGIESENPPGGERRVAEFVVDWFDAEGVDATLVEEPSAERAQAVAEVGDPDSGPTLVLNGHTDVVPAGDTADWTHDPFVGEIESDRLYGRGAVDMKTGLAAAMLAARDLADDLESGALDGAVVVHAAMGEETGDPGTRTLIDRGWGGDCAVVLEPTGCRVATTAKGVTTFRVGVAGTASHASHPDRGTNAVAEVRPVLDAIDAYDAGLREREDPLVGRAYATVTEIEAGTGSNMAVVPDHAEFLLDRRVLPGETLAAVRAEVEEMLAEAEQSAGVETDLELVQHYAAAGIDADHALAEPFRRLSAEMAGASTEPWGLEAATDAREFIRAGIPAIIWGPGGLAQAHAVDEWIDLDEAAVGLEILERAARELLSA